MLLTVFLMGCFMTPTEVNKEDVKRGMVQQRDNIVCVGLEMPDPELQTYATEQIRTFETEVAAACICEKIRDPDGGYREAVIEGMKGEDRNGVVQCVLDVIADSTLDNREAAIRSLGTMHAPIIGPAMIAIAENASDSSEVRAAAVYAFGREEKNHDALVGMASDSDPVVQAEIMRALGYQTQSSTARKIIKAQLSSPESKVRAASVEAWRMQKKDAGDEEICPIMMSDESPEVRIAAQMSFKFTTSRDSVRCLRERALLLEEDSDVRDNMLYILKNTRGDAEEPAYQVLCDAIPFWLRNYVKDKRPEDLPGTEIVQAQNDVDFEKSPECFRNAYQRSAGYSCYAKEHIATWYGHVTGNDKLNVPECPEYDEEE
jgi:HEAT repeat protein